MRSHEARLRAIRQPEACARIMRARLAKFAREKKTPKPSAMAPREASNAGGRFGRFGRFARFARSPLRGLVKRARVDFRVFAFLVRDTKARV